VLKKFMGSIKKNSSRAEKIGQAAGFVGEVASFRLALC
jgi:hypothetical protein